MKLDEAGAKTLTPKMSKNEHPLFFKSKSPKNKKQMKKMRLAASSKENRPNSRAVSGTRQKKHAKNLMQTAQKLSSQSPKESKKYPKFQVMETSISTLKQSYGCENGLISSSKKKTPAGAPSQSQNMNQDVRGLYNISHDFGANENQNCDDELLFKGGQAQFFKDLIRACPE